MKAGGVGNQTEGTFRESGQLKHRVTRTIGIRPISDQLDILTKGSCNTHKCWKKRFRGIFRTTDGQQLESFDAHTTVSFARRTG
ncbi:MAG TPA: hypothetical protein VNY06_05635, partial [Methylocella sp.]|nr:hypothetical protein [Methylocella sp.]